MIFLANTTKRQESLFFLFLLTYRLISLSAIDGSFAMASKTARYAPPGPHVVQLVLFSITMQLAIYIENKLTVAITANYSQVIPWYIRLYYHTMEFSLNHRPFPSPEAQAAVITDLKVQPATDRAWPGLFDAKLKLPPRSRLAVVINFETNFLHWAEFPPDAHRGTCLLSTPTLIVVFDQWFKALILGQESCRWTSRIRWSEKNCWRSNNVDS